MDSATIGGMRDSLNEQMAHRVKYLQEEARGLKEMVAAETGRARMVFTPDQRRRLALKGKTLTPADRKSRSRAQKPSWRGPAKWRQEARQLRRP